MLRPPKKSIPIESRHPVQKNMAILPEMCSPELGKKSLKKERKKEPIFEHYISPLCRINPAGPICTIFGR